MICKTCKYVGYFGCSRCKDCFQGDRWIAKGDTKAEDRQAMSRQFTKNDFEEYTMADAYCKFYNIREECRDVAVQAYASAWNLKSKQVTELENSMHDKIADLEAELHKRTQQLDGALLLLDQVNPIR